MPEWIRGNQDRERYWLIRYECIMLRVKIIVHKWETCLLNPTKWSTKMEEVHGEKKKDARIEWDAKMKAKKTDEC